MDTSEWSSNLAVRNKEPIVTVREILQDSDVDDQIIEPCSSHSPRKRNYYEVERNSIITPSIRNEKKQVSPAKRQRNDRGMGSICLQTEHNGNSRGTVFMEKEIAESKKGNERIPETPKIGKLCEGFEVTLSPNNNLINRNMNTRGSAPPSSHPSGRDGPESSGTNETTSIEASMLPIETLSPALAHLSSAYHENPRSNSISSSSDQYKYHNLKSNYEHIPHNTSKAQIPKERSDKYEYKLNNTELNKNCEQISNTFESLFPTVEDWIELQRSQLDTVSERINRIFSLIQQGERLLQNVMTTENASQLELLIDRITHVLAEDFRIDDSSSAVPNFPPERDFVAQLTNVYVSTDPSQTLEELQQFAKMRSNMNVSLSEKEERFVDTIEALGATQTKLKEEWNMLNLKEGKSKFKFMLEMNSCERAKVLQRVWDLKKEIANFYMCADTIR
ncbi:uncharacterized protein Bfra_008774 [Botrytis fragariae]|uniref:Uncharacterized protein n=1 Tax=Botrytis fragariae TaxID=1964551 RepID=A0A8H6AQZ3_9HELO|nr:uncharacterized protein Bfra_008774 [Botrytis fragariae]KAF5871750.1 hypothetical protein Bfra_008774 [Botrytis fragariae]